MSIWKITEVYRNLDGLCAIPRCRPSLIAIEIQIRLATPCRGGSFKRKEVCEHIGRMTSQVECKEH
ncbi:MAG: hypothetical protein EB143_05200 [Actinobacteria bacterium]|nr:hypothetical protein [Actinomycetota bacterium]